jgi:hypothetical protein
LTDELDEPVRQSGRAPHMSRADIGVEKMRHSSSIWGRRRSLRAW